MNVNLDEPLDFLSREGQEFLRGIQGNILESHRRKHAAHVFVRFDTDPKNRINIAKRLSQFAQTYGITAAHERGYDDWRTPERLELLGHSGINPPEAGVHNPDSPFAMLLLTYEGYKVLGLEHMAPDDPVFREGMKKQNRILEEWESPYDGDPGPIHALVILGANDAALLDCLVSTVRSFFREHALTGILGEERGNRLWFGPNNGWQREHFGFRDGLSQPYFFKRSAAPGNGSVLDSSTPLWVVLVKDPGVDSGEYGSLLAYQKLEQDVEGFNDGVGHLAQRLGIAEDDAFALTVGRYKNGEPLVKNPPDQDNPLERNGFDFRDDPDGMKCPYHAHIRKMNPREDRFGSHFADKRSGNDERYIRIARRGIPYGPEGDNPSEPRGLLFMSFQGDLEQFRFYEWTADERDFLPPETGVDAILGRTPPAPPGTPAFEVACVSLRDATAKLADAKSALEKTKRLDEEADEAEAAVDDVEIIIQHAQALAGSNEEAMTAIKAGIDRLKQVTVVLIVPGEVPPDSLSSAVSSLGSTHQRIADAFNSLHGLQGLLCEAKTALGEGNLAETGQAVNRALGANLPAGHWMKVMFEPPLKAIAEAALALARAQNRKAGTSAEERAKSLAAAALNRAEEEIRKAIEPLSQADGVVATAGKALVEAHGALDETWQALTATATAQQDISGTKDRLLKELERFLQLLDSRVEKPPELPQIWQHLDQVLKTAGEKLETGHPDATLEQEGAGEAIDVAEGSLAEAKSALAAADGPTKAWKRQHDVQQWPNSEGEKKTTHLANYVTLRGGEFFFAPSMAVLKSLPRRVKEVIPPAPPPPRQPSRQA